MSIVDAYETLVSKRPYKKTFAAADAVDIFMAVAGNSFDPKITELSSQCGNNSGK
ncbi:MAG: hypothetical protein FWG59_06190 [Betaproteobacteria bacterium]|nr:hypothetical protein [Betaproteobacteria bacterium]